MGTVWIWAFFIIFILVLLVFDLTLFHKVSQKEPNVKKELLWTIFWIALALAFSFVIYYVYENPKLHQYITLDSHISGHKAVLQYITGYIIEKSLSIDNLFVISFIFSNFHIPAKYQHRVLFFGILGALVFRGIMIALGAVMIAKFAWSFYLFGALLIITAIKFFIDRNDTPTFEENLLIRLVKKFFNIVPSEGHHFFVRKNNKIAITSLFLALIVIEGADVVFAIDSIPAIFAVTQEPFIVFTSNVFAILGLRSLYFVLSKMMDKFHYLKISLVFILLFVGIKMLLHHHFVFPIWVSLIFILGILMLGVAASIFGPKKNPIDFPNP